MNDTISAKNIEDGTKKIIKILKTDDVVAVSAPTGTGKSTEIPKLLAAKGKKVFISLPTVEAVKSLVKYQKKISPKKNIGSAYEGDVYYTDSSDIIYATSGHLENLMFNFFKEGVCFNSNYIADYLILDEIHTGKKSNNSIIRLWKRCIDSGGNVPKLILTSATQNLSMFSDMDLDIKMIEIEVKSYNIETIFNDINYFVNGKTENDKFSKALDDEFLKENPSKKNKVPSRNGLYKDIAKKIVDYHFRFIDGDKLGNKHLLKIKKKLRKELKEAKKEEDEDRTVILEKNISEIDENLKELGVFLVIVPGYSEINKVKEEIIKLGKNIDKNNPLFITTMSAGTSPEEKERSLIPAPLANIMLDDGEERSVEQRKIVIGTNIIETAITINNVVLVIDSGREKIAVRDSNGNKVLKLVFESKSSSIQRKGRGGRTRDSYYHLMATEEQFNRNNQRTSNPLYPDNRKEEIYRVPLYETIIKALSAGINPEYVISPKVKKIIEKDVFLLKMLNMVSKNNKITPKGEFANNFPLGVRNSSLLWDWLSIEETSIFPGIVMVCLIDSYDKPYIYIPYNKDDTMSEYMKKTQKYISEKFINSETGKNYRGESDLHTFVNIWSDMLRSLNGLYVNKKWKPNSFDVRGKTIRDPKTIKKYTHDNSLNYKSITALLRQIERVKRKISSLVFLGKINLQKRNTEPVPFATATAVAKLKSILPFSYYDKMMTRISDSEEYKYKNSGIYINYNDKLFISNKSVNEVAEQGYPDIYNISSYGKIINFAITTEIEESLTSNIFVDISKNLKLNLNKDRLWHYNPHIRERFINNYHVDEISENVTEINILERKINKYNPKLKYSETDKRKKHTVIHWDARGDFLCSLEFLNMVSSRYTKEDVIDENDNNIRESIVIFTGCYEYYSIVFLHEFFPRSIFFCYGVKPSKHIGVISNIDMIGEIDEKIFYGGTEITPSHAREYIKKVKEYDTSGGELYEDLAPEVFYIGMDNYIHETFSNYEDDSDIELKEKYNSIIIERIKDVISSIVPLNVSVRLRLPYTNKYTSFVKGQKFIIPFSKESSIAFRVNAKRKQEYNKETREITHYYESVQYKNKEFEEMMSYFNNITRTNYYHNDYEYDPDVGLDHCYDCSSELFIIDSYIRSTMSEIYHEKDIKNMVYKKSKKLTNILSMISNSRKKL